MENIEKIMKFCSKMGEVFEYPYFFNWSTPTNFRDNSSEGELQDVDYVIFRVGKYISPKDTIEDGVVYSGRKEPVEKQLMFAHVNRIIDYTPLNHAIADERDSLPAFKDFKIKNLEDLEKHKEQLKKFFDEFLEKQN